MCVGQHIRIRYSEDRVVAENDGERRILARVVLKLGKDYRLLSFRSADTHLHIETACDRRSAGEFARRVEISLRHRLPHDAQFARVKIDGIRSQNYLYNTFDYTINQDKHHGSHLRENVEKLLPRVDPPYLKKFLGGLDLEHPIHTLEPLAEAAASAVALPTVTSNHPAAVLARATAIKIAAPHMKRKQVAELLKVSLITVKRCLKKRVPQSLWDAVLLQLRLRQQKMKSKL
jgi:hypothetical protein